MKDVTHALSISLLRADTNLAESPKQLCKVVTVGGTVTKSIWVNEWARGMNHRARSPFLQS